MRFPRNRKARMTKSDRRKDKCVFPARKKEQSAGSVYSGSMTLEAALALPLFLFALLAVLQFAKIGIVSSALLAAMEDTAKDIAVYAYVQQLGVTAGDGIAADLLTGGLSAAYAKSRVQEKANLKASDGSIQLWRSSFLKNDIIDLAVTYEAKNTYTILPIPKVRTALRARVRAWTGRDGSAGGEADGEEGTQEETVFVTETGQVYHTNEDCTHIRLSIQSVSRDDVDKLRNSSGGKYHACEKCHGGTGGIVYITDYGDRYHSSAGCSGIKRSVLQVPLSEVEGWKVCSKCSNS